MRFQLLGPVTVSNDGTTISLGPVKQRTLLAALLLEPDRVVPMDSLVSALWDGEPPRSAVSNVRTYASRLGGALVDQRRRRRVVGRNPGYVLHAEEHEIDATVFQRLVHTGRTALAANLPDRAAKAFGDALAIWQGDAAEDVYRSAYLSRRLIALGEQRLAVTEEWIAARQLLREDAELIAELRRLTSLYPLRERLWCQLILSLYRVGDIGGALAGYQNARAVLVSDLGVDPGPELIRLHQSILVRDPALDGLVASTPDCLATVAPPAPRPTTAWMPVPRELPPATANLIGRSKELSVVVGTIAARNSAGSDPAAGGPTVVAVYGPAGVGKSALAIRAATQLAPAFPDGQLYADLRATAADGQRRCAVDILGRFLRALGIPDDQVPSDADEAAARFRSVAANRRMLTVLDNADDEACVRPLLTATRGSAVVLTSRRMLAALDCTVHVEVGPLDMADAVDMLADFCGADLTDAGRDQLWHLADLCDGLPLALRIVAARLTAAADLPIERLAAQLAQERRRRDALSFGDLTMSRSGHR